MTEDRDDRIEHATLRDEALLRLKDYQLKEQA